MSKVDWSLAPDDATHARDYQRGVDFYKRESGLWLFWDRAKWDVAVGTSEKDCERRPKPWSGPEDGLPPVGSTVQVRDQEPHKCYAHHCGKSATILAHRIGSYSEPVAVYHVSGLDGLDEYHALVEACFRPIRTPEQLAAEEREKAVIDFKQVLDELSQDYCMHLTPHAIDWLAVRLDRAGFKREVV